MNKVILTGRLVEDVAINYSQNNKAWCNNKVAVQRPYKDANGEYGADFIPLSLWGKTAEYLGKYGKKGQRIEVIGSWNTRNFQDKDGQTRYVNEVLVQEIQVQFDKQEENKEESQPKNEKKKEEELVVELVNNDDLPF